MVTRVVSNSDGQVDGSRSTDSDEEGNDKVEAVSGPSGWLESQRISISSLSDRALRELLSSGPM